MGKKKGPLSESFFRSVPLVYSGSILTTAVGSP
jgi:hypothetical protein